MIFLYRFKLLIAISDNFFSISIPKRFLNLYFLAMINVLPAPHPKSIKLNLEKFIFFSFFKNSIESFTDFAKLG